MALVQRVHQYDTGWRTDGVRIHRVRCAYPMSEVFLKKKFFTLFKCRGDNARRSRDVLKRNRRVIKKKKHHTERVYRTLHPIRVSNEFSGSAPISTCVRLRLRCRGMGVCGGLTVAVVTGRTVSGELDALIAPTTVRYISYLKGLAAHYTPCCFPGGGAVNTRFGGARSYIYTYNGYNPLVERNLNIATSTAAR